ncbi:hypothetical protein [Changpingibacter yushuensis]|uniref:hypothetical protein n=1 Tax=Changpingibacter yushuensis TaxID=2758440 RepID=UPI0015F516AB|nr:hypothetical protein [Changpingibacter yushuensis]
MSPSTTRILADDSNLHGQWSTFVSVVGGDGSFLTFLAVIGIAMIVAGVIMMMWTKRRGGKASGAVYLMIIGVVLAAPKAVIPLVLLGWDFFANIVIGIATRGFGG